LVIVAAVLLSSPSALSVGSSNEVSVYNWTTYIPDSVKEDFTKETGIKLNYEEYDSNETMLAKVAGGGVYDVAFPSQDFVPIMIDRGLIVELDKDRIPNLAAVDQNIMASSQSFDPGNAYAAPYNVGATGIVYWKDKIKNPVQSFSLFGDRRYSGRILLIDDSREVFGAALHNLGFSGNTTDKAALSKATDLIGRWTANGQRFDTDDAPTKFLKKEAWAVFLYPENIMMQLDDSQKPLVGLIFPNEGCMKYQDNMVILKAGQNRENAYQFINYMLRPDIQARLDDEYGYPGIETSALALRKNPPYYSSAVLDSAEFRKPLGENADLYNKAWEKVRGQ
jgi:spermidine/putrescine-binding protein